MSLDNANCGEELATNALPPGTMLFKDQYAIRDVLSSGGFGISYIAEASDGRSIVIKECFPEFHCFRQNTRVRARGHNSQYEVSRILRQFLREARCVASLHHPGVIKVHQVFQENDTAYIAMDKVDGKDLYHHAHDPLQNGCKKWIIALALRLVTVLDYIHSNDVLHGDIAPDNILVTTTDEPVLIDFGAASWLSDKPGSRSSELQVVKDGYSPHELYYANAEIGPWTDIYSLAATINFTVTGLTPVDSQRRLAAKAERAPDPLPALGENHLSLPSGFLHSIDRALGILPKQRYQSAKEWLRDLQPFMVQEDPSVKLLDKALGLRRPKRPEKGVPPEVAAEADPVAYSTFPEKDSPMSLDINGLNEISGFIGGCLVDSETGMMLAAVGGGKFDLEAASAANTEVVRAKNEAIRILGLNDTIEDILISLGKQYHLIRPIEKAQSIFLYVALDRKTANLGLARVQLKKVEQGLTI